MIKNILILLLLAASSLMAAEVNIYSHRHYDTDQVLYDQFEKETGIKVNVVKAAAGELIKRLQMEGRYSPADLFIASDIANLYRVKSLGLFQETHSKILEKNIPAHLRDPENFWFGLTKRARVIVYDKKRTNPKAFSTYMNLADSKWEKKILIRSSNNTYNQSLLASIIANEGEGKALQWAKGMVKNFARRPKGADRDQMIALAAGQGEIAVVNTYYLGQLATSKNPKDRKVAENLSVFFPNQESTGTHINISGGGITRSSKNKKEALRLLEYLSSPQAQQQFANGNFEYPVNVKNKPSNLVASWGTFKEDILSLETIGKYNGKAIEIFDQVRWR